MTMARILDGKALAQRLRQHIREEIVTFREQTQIIPRLEVVLVGEDPASKVYIRNKTQACTEAGVISNTHILSGDASINELLDLIGRLNETPEVHGILVQLPLPKSMDSQTVISAINPLKDVDGFHPENAGLLAIGSPRFIPCTPLGVSRLLQAENIETRGRQAVVLGRSNIVGKPMALLLMSKSPQGDATVTVCHTATPNPQEIAKEADILIAAMGQPEAVNANWIKPGAVVIDVGIHRKPAGGLCGDVDYQSVAPIASAITPVPGGVGPLTVAMLIENTLLAAKNRVS